MFLSLWDQTLYSWFSSVQFLKLDLTQPNQAEFIVKILFKKYIFAI